MFIDEMQRSRIWQLLENAISEITEKQLPCEWFTFTLNDYAEETKQYFKQLSCSMRQRTFRHMRPA